MCGIFGCFGNYDREDCLKCLDSIRSRGPDNQNTVEREKYFLGFNRLCINDLTENGNQPMSSGNVHMMCNGEIYNHLEIQKHYNLECKSRSDCEVILRAYVSGVDMDELCNMINGDFAFVIVDENLIIAARDRVGVRPLFYGFTTNSQLIIASEVKAMKMCESVRHIVPAHIYQFSKRGPRWEYSTVRYWEMPTPTILSHPKVGEFRKILDDAVKLRLESDRPIGCLLSGGLDSTVVTYLLVQALGVANVRTYSIGMEGSIDLYYADKVARAFGIIHTEVKFTPQEGIRAIPEVIKALESYDITTVRASVGMYLLGKYIAENTDDKVIFSGELSDELMCGYLYFHHAPTDEDAYAESKRLVSNVYKYDALRADRCISTHGLELRVPFADKNVMDYCLSLSGSVKRPKNGVEKRIIREQFVGDIANDILWRRKDGFSDGVSAMGKPWYEYIKEFVEDKVTDEITDEFPSKEALYYRNIYRELYPNFHRPVEEHWMPKWVNVDKSNPSGRIIKIE